MNENIIKNAEEINLMLRFLAKGSLGKHTHRRWNNGEDQQAPV